MDKQAILERFDTLPHWNNCSFNKGQRCDCGKAVLRAALQSSRIVPNDSVVLAKEQGIEIESGNYGAGCICDVCKTVTMSLVSQLAAIEAGKEKP